MHISVGKHSRRQHQKNYKNTGILTLIRSSQGTCMRLHAKPALHSSWMEIHPKHNQNHQQYPLQAILHMEHKFSYVSTTKSIRKGKLLI